MAWNDDEGGGPWGKGPGDNNNPWGKNRKPGGGNEPDLEEIIKQSQDRIKRLFPNGKGNNNILIVAAVGLLGLWLSSGIYTVDESEEAAVLRFGKWVRTASPGWNYHLPMPIETAIVQNVRQVNTFTNTQANTSGDVMAGEGSLMLTGDENIADVQYVVNWRVKNLDNFLFQASSPISTMQAGADSVVREVIAQTPIAHILSEGRTEINTRLKTMLQALVDQFDFGIEITQIKLLKVTPPTAKVMEAYLDVQRAKADMERKRNEAVFYRNSIVPVARGQAKKMIEDAEAYKSKVVAEASGETQRFSEILAQYRANPNVTRARLYYQTMGAVLGSATKIITDDASGQGIVPYLPLPELKKVSEQKVSEQTPGPEEKK